MPDPFDHTMPSPSYPPVPAADAVDRVPLVLPPNQPADRPYRGGAGIARFRGLSPDTVDPYTPEDFVGSVTEVHAGGGVGLTVLPDGRTLRAAIAADPEWYLGPEHVHEYGDDSMLLVKLLDTGERLFVHFHPADEFARTRMGEPRGKTEAWIILDVVDGRDGYAAVGFSRPVGEDEAAEWFRTQDADAMLAAMHRIPLRPGDTLLVPAGIPHAIGPGITLLELQQPADLSILLEYKGFRGLDAESALMELDVDGALQALDRHPWTPEAVRALASPGRPQSPDRELLFPPEADRFFRAERIVCSGSASLEPGFSILVVVSGAGRLVHRGGSIPLARGTTTLLPFGVGTVDLLGDLTVVRARPPQQ